MCLIGIMSIFLLAIRSHVLHPLYHHTVTMLYSFSFEARYLVKCYYNIMLQLCSIVTAGTHTTTFNVPIFQWYSLYNVSSCIQVVFDIQGSCVVLSAVYSGELVLVTMLSANERRLWVTALSQWEETLCDCLQREEKLSHCFKLYEAI